MVCRLPGYTIQDLYKGVSILAQDDPGDDRIPPVFLPVDQLEIPAFKKWRSGLVAVVNFRVKRVVKITGKCS